MAQMRTEIRVPSAHANTQTSLDICNPRTGEAETRSPGAHWPATLPKSAGCVRELYLKNYGRCDGGRHLMYTSGFHVTLHTHTKGEGGKEGGLT